MIMTYDEGIEKINGIDEIEAFWILSDTNGSINQRYTESFFNN